MRLPIDFREVSRPIREKYLIDETPGLAPWMEFGVHANGAVDAGTCADVFVAVPPDVARRLIDARQTFCDAVLGIVNSAVD